MTINVYFQYEHYLNILWQLQSTAQFVFIDLDSSRNFKTFLTALRANESCGSGDPQKKEHRKLVFGTALSSAYFYSISTFCPAL